MAWRAWLARQARAWLPLLAVFFFVKGCVLDQYIVPTNSMFPTLQGQWKYFKDDRVLVNKWIYGPRIPFTTRRLRVWGEPKRWDIVVFRTVDQGKNQAQKTLIKRVVGLPGERVHIQGGRIFVNGQPQEPPADLKWLNYISTEPPSPAETKRRFLLWAQAAEPPSILNSENPGSRQLLKDLHAWHGKVQGIYLDAQTEEQLDTLCEGVAPVSLAVTAEFIQGFLRPQLQYGVRSEDQFSAVPPDHYFLLGDNSTDSGDGRIWGWVPQDHLYGPAIAIWWPFSRRRDFTGFSHTWWGKTLIYGIPLGLIALDAAGSWRRRKAKRS